jgi:outer membrane receptor protein involved in Fe transport
VSGRHEDYSDFGTTTNPKLGVLYAPFHDLSLRGSWGTSFRAPDLYEEYSGIQLYTYPLSAFNVPGPPNAQVLLQMGANPYLRPETARSWTTGFDYKPDWVPDLRISTTYYNIDYQSRITQPISNLAAALTNPLYAPFVTPNPSAAMQAALFAQAQYTANFSGAPYDPLDVTSLVRAEYQNVVSQHTHGVDVIGAYRIHEAAGDFDISLNAAWLSLSQVLSPGSPETTISGTVFNPPKFRSRLGLTWQRGVWSAASFVNYAARETDNTSPVLVDVASWTTVDANISYDASNWGALCRHLIITAAAQNLLDRNPPALNATSTIVPSLGYDGTNASPLGRFVSIIVRKNW